MNENNLSTQPANQFKNNLCLVPEQFLHSVLQRQEKILELLQGKETHSLNGFISEKQAMDILHKKGTWFWQMRTTGKLPFRKLGKTIYYSLTDINSLLTSK